MQPVLDPEPAVAGVELEVVEVVELGGEGEGEVVAGVVIHHLEKGDIYRTGDIRVNQYKATEQPLSSDWSRS